MSTSKPFQYTGACKQETWPELIKRLLSDDNFIVGYIEDDDSGIVDVHFRAIREDQLNGILHYILVLEHKDD